MISDDIVQDGSSGGGSTFHQLVQQVGRLEVSVENTNRAVASLAESVKMINQRQIEGSKPNWNMLAVIASIAIAVAIGLFTYINQPLSQIRFTQQEFTHDYLDHVRDGHPRSVRERVEENKEDIIHMDEVLQREMRILDRAIDEKIEGLDKRLQQEMRLLNNTQNERITSLADWRKIVDAWILKHEQSVSGINRTQDEKLRRLEEWERRAKDQLKENLGTDAEQRERILDLEREVYSGAMYRAGRPIKPTHSQPSHGEIVIHHEYPKEK